MIQIKKNRKIKFKFLLFTLATALISVGAVQSSLATQGNENLSNRSSKSKTEEDVNEFDINASKVEKQTAQPDYLSINNASTALNTEKNESTVNDSIYNGKGGDAEFDIYENVKETANNVNNIESTQGTENNKNNTYGTLVDNDEIIANGKNDNVNGTVENDLTEEDDIFKNVAADPWEKNFVKFFIEFLRNLKNVDLESEVKTYILESMHISNVIEAFDFEKNDIKDSVKGSKSWLEKCQKYFPFYKVAFLFCRAMCGSLCEFEKCTFYDLNYKKVVVKNFFENFKKHLCEHFTNFIVSKKNNIDVGLPADDVVFGGLTERDVVSEYVNYMRGKFAFNGGTKYGSYYAYDKDETKHVKVEGVANKQDCVGFVKYIFDCIFKKMYQSLLLNIKDYINEFFNKSLIPYEDKKHSEEIEAVKNRLKKNYTDFFSVEFGIFNTFFADDVYTYLKEIFVDEFFGGSSANDRLGKLTELSVNLCTILEGQEQEEFLKQWREEKEKLLKQMQQRLSESQKRDPAEVYEKKSQELFAKYKEDAAKLDEKYDDKLHKLNAQPREEELCEKKLYNEKLTELFAWKNQKQSNDDYQENKKKLTRWYTQQKEKFNKQLSKLPKSRASDKQKCFENLQGSCMFSTKGSDKLQLDKNLYENNLKYYRNIIDKKYKKKEQDIQKDLIDLEKQYKDRKEKLRNEYCKKGLKLEDGNNDIINDFESNALIHDKNEIIVDNSAKKENNLNLNGDEIPDFLELNDKEKNFIDDIFNIYQKVESFKLKEFFDVKKNQSLDFLKNDYIKPIIACFSFTTNAVKEKEMSKFSEAKKDSTSGKDKDKKDKMSEAASDENKYFPRRPICEAFIELCKCISPVLDYLIDNGSIKINYKEFKTARDSVLASISKKAKNTTGVSTLKNKNELMDSKFMKDLKYNYKCCVLNKIGFGLKRIIWDVLSKKFVDLGFFDLLKKIDKILLACVYKEIKRERGNVFKFVENDLLKNSNLFFEYIFTNKKILSSLPVIKRNLEGKFNLGVINPQTKLIDIKDWENILNVICNGIDAYNEKHKQDGLGICSTDEFLEKFEKFYEALTTRICQFFWGEICRKQLGLGISNN